MEVLAVMAMLTNADFAYGAKITVTTYGIIGDTNTFTGVVSGVVSHALVPTTANAEINHANLWPVLPASTQSQITNDYRTYPYLCLLQEDGTPVYLGLPWMELNVVSVTTRIATVVISPFTDADKSAISELLRLNNYTVSSVSIAE